jgi:hypothetical protein
LRYAVYVVGALLLFFVALGMGAAAALVVGWQPERAQAGYGGPAGSETREDTAPAEARTGAEAFEGTAIEPDDGEEGTNTDREEPPEDTAKDTAKGASFVHRATDGNSRGDYTYLSDPAIDGEPGAVVLATASAVRGGAQDAYGHNVGVWYEAGAQKWAIFNQDLAAVPAGATFRVVLPPASGSFVHRAADGNSRGDHTYLSDPLTNGEPGAVVSVTQNWNPGGGPGVYNDHPVGVFYDEDVQKWAIENRDGARMPEGAAFNVAVSGSDESAR